MGEQITELDPEYVYGPGQIAWSHWFDCVYGWSESPEESLEKATASVQRIFEIDSADKFAHKHAQLSVVLALHGEYDRAIELAEKSVKLLPDDGGNLGSLGWIFVWAGESERAKTVLHRYGVTFVKGEDNLASYKVPDAEMFKQVFCRTCGSLMPEVYPEQEVSCVSLGALDTDPGRPDDNIFVAYRAPWYEITDGLDCYDAAPPGSYT